MRCTSRYRKTPPQFKAAVPPICIVLGAALLAIAGRAGAQASFAPTSVFVQAGTTGNTRSLTAGVTRDWARQWRLGGGRVTGYWEASVSEWSYLAVEARRTAWLGQVGLVPVFRYRPNGGASPWYFEAGVGLTLTTSLYETDRKRFSTSFNFGDHLAVGRNFGQRSEHELSLRLQHFSNGGIKHPNPGEDFIQLRYAYRFL